VSFAVAAGASTAYLGVNGAGKSTTIKVLAGVLTRTSGSCVVAGRPPRANRYARAKTIGVVFGHRTQLWWDLPVEESFRILGRPHDLSPQRAEANRRVLDLGAIAHRPVRTLSVGQRMRAELAAALFHDHRVLLLDEPTIGLDLLLKDAVHELVNRVVNEGATTVLLTSHDVADITTICQQVVVVHQGRVVYSGSLAGLLRRATTRTVLVDFLAETTAEDLAADVASTLGAEVEAIGRHRLQVHGRPEVATPQRVLHAAPSPIWSLLSRPWPRCSRRCTRPAR
jgi:ABC-2 type transport system ATP-binding protein